MTVPLLTTSRFELWQPALRDLPDLFELTLAEETRRNAIGAFEVTDTAGIHDADVFNAGLQNGVPQAASLR